MNEVILSPTDSNEFLSVGNWRVSICAHLTGLIDMEGDILRHIRWAGMMQRCNPHPSSLKWE